MGSEMYLGELDGWIQIAQVVLLSILVTQNMGLREQLRKIQERLERGS